jgi:murein L,D-transpeptidase YafK
MKNTLPQILLMLMLVGTVSVLVHESRRDNNRINTGPLIKADKVLANKSERKLYLLNGVKVFREYKIALGDSPVGHKQQEGDERTSEGDYLLDWRNARSVAYKSLHVSYPNANDREHARKLGASPGGSIMVHGIMNGYESLGSVLQTMDWTDGCIAVLNHEMDEIWKSVRNGTPIRIEP